MGDKVKSFVLFVLACVGLSSWPCAYMCIFCSVHAPIGNMLSLAARWTRGHGAAAASPLGLLNSTAPTIHVYIQFLQGRIVQGKTIYNPENNL